MLATYKRFGSTLLGLVVSGSLLACGQASMQDAEIPADFSFDTTAPLRIALDPKQPEGTPAPEIYRGVEITRTNGHVIYRGPMPVDRPLVVNLGLPLADREVRLTLLSEVDQVDRVLPVIDGVVRAEIR